MKIVRIVCLSLMMGAMAVAGCQSQGSRVQIDKQRAENIDLELTGGLVADNSGSLYMTTPTTVMRYEPGVKRMEDLLIDSCRGIRDVAVTSDGVVLILRGPSLEACVAGYPVGLYNLPGDGIAVSCDREFAYVLAAHGDGARLVRIFLTGGDKGKMQTLLATEDRPSVLCAVRGGCLVASGGNIFKVAVPAPGSGEGEVATVLLAAIREPVTSVVADPSKLIVYFATSDTTYAWIQGQIVPIFPAGSRLAWAKDTLTICLPSHSISQTIRIPGVAKHTEGLLKQLETGVRGEKS